MAFKKKLYARHPQRAPLVLDTVRTFRKNRRENADAMAIERDVRQRLAEKISGNLVGLWLLVPEHLRLGTWDLWNQWAGPSASDLPARLALQLVHEAARCLKNTRARRSLPQRGFELLNGLPFLAADQALHDLLQAHTVEQAERLQLALGGIRRARGHFRGQLLAIDPHRMPSYSQRQMPRYRDNHTVNPYKVSQAFFCLDADSAQPLGVLLATSSMKVSQETPRLLKLAHPILNPSAGERPLLLADKEHYSQELFHYAPTQTHFDLLIPMPHSQSLGKSLQAIPPSDFHPRWAGWATTHRPFAFKHWPELSLCQLVQRSGEKPADYYWKAFLATRYRDEVQDLALHFPQRWVVEEFFKNYQDLGGKVAGTLNLNIRYAQMTMALVAQAACHQLRHRLAEPLSGWDSWHLASSIFRGLAGDIRVSHDTSLVTLYNVPHKEALKPHYENLPSLLEQEKIDPRIPWLFNFKLDFRFR